jgi:hypothetical protein
MSIRVGIYDFFAYTIPGVFYIIILGFWLNVLGIVTLDLQALNSFSLTSMFLIIGAGYILGLLIDQVAYRWVRLFQSENREAVRFAFDEFHESHPWVVLNFEPQDWGILLRAIKSKSMDAAADIEQHNVAAIMFRNFSLGLVLSALACLLYFLLVYQAIANILLAIICLQLSFAAMKRGRIRRHWFYMAIFEGFTAHFLLEKKLSGRKPRANSAHPLDDISEPTSPKTI